MRNRNANKNRVSESEGSQTVCGREFYKDGLGHNTKFVDHIAWRTKRHADRDVFLDDVVTVIASISKVTALKDYKLSINRPLSS